MSRDKHIGSNFRTSLKMSFVVASAVSIASFQAALAQYDRVPALGTAPAAPQNDRIPALAPAPAAPQSGVRPRPPGPPGSNPSTWGPISSNRALKSYFHSPYGFCDAKKVASVWKVDISEGKVVIGRKILQRRTSLVDSDIASASNVPCLWEETDLTFDDAQALATYWGRSVPDAKTKATDLVSRMGTKKFRRTVLARVGE